MHCLATVLALGLVVPTLSFWDDAPDLRIIDHDKIPSLPINASAEELRWQPYLATDGHSCVPFPVVDNAGHVSGGLWPSGKITGDCATSTGQTYVRSTIVKVATNDTFSAHMYTWYLVSARSMTALTTKTD